MHVGPPCMCRHICHLPVSGVGCMNGFHVRILDRVGDGYSFIDAHLTCKSFQKEWIYGDDLFASILVFRQDAVSYFFEDRALLVRLAISVLEKILDSAKLKASVYRSSVEGDMTTVSIRSGGCCLHRRSRWWSCLIGKSNFGGCRLFYLHQGFFIRVWHHEDTVELVSNSLEIIQFSRQLISRAVQGKKRVRNVYCLDLEIRIWVIWF